MGVSDKMFLNLLVIVLPALASASCPAGTFMFEQNSKCLSLADHCFNQNKLIRADLRGCGKKCERDEEPQIHTNKCINLHCKLYTNSGLNQEQRCVPCPEGMTTSEDGKSCVGRSPWGECKLEAEKTRSVSCEGPFCDQIPSTETEQCGDQMTKKLETLFLEMNMMKSKIEALESDKNKLRREVLTMKGEISTLESDKNNLRREVTTMKREVTTMKSDKKKIESKISTIESDKNNLRREVTSMKNEISTLERRLTTEKQGLESKVNSLESRIIKLENDKTSKERRLTKIENKPYAFQCAYQDNWTAEKSIVKWDKFITNLMRGVTGGLSLSSGEFTVGHSGVWEVPYTLRSANERESWSNAYLYINGRRLSESEFHTGWFDSVFSMGSRTLFIKLNRGDKVTLQTTGLNGNGLYLNTLCFHLAQPL